MSFRNLTPLPCLPFEALTPEGERVSVVVARIILDLVPAAPHLRAQGFTHALKLSQDQVPLVLADAYHGAFQESSIFRENEASPMKPNCDVVLDGQARAPGGRPCRHFEASLKVIAADGTCLLHKRLQVTGERWLRHRRLLARLFWKVVKGATLGLLRRCPWVLTEPQLLTGLPVRYEYAFGGMVRAKASDSWVRGVPDRACLPGVDKVRMLQAWEASRTEGLLAQEWWAENPVGRGYAPLWFLEASRASRFPAPQIEDPVHPFTAEAAWAAMEGKATGPLSRSLVPQGLGMIGRTWQPRVAWAGTWDQAWAESGAPYPPDYSEAFENGAPPDLQCRHLGGDEVVELVNLGEPPGPDEEGVRSGDRTLRFRLPGLFPFLHLVNDDDEWEQIPLALDTVMLEPDLARVTLLQRVRYRGATGSKILELRLAMPGEPREVPLLPGADEDDGSSFEGRGEEAHA